MAQNEGENGLHYFILVIFLSSSSASNSKKLLDDLTNTTRTPISIIFLGRGVPDSGPFRDIACVQRKAVSDIGSFKFDFYEVSFIA